MTTCYSGIVALKIMIPKTFINLYDDKDTGEVVIRALDGDHRIKYSWYFAILEKDIQEDRHKYLVEFKNLQRQNQIDKVVRQGKWLRIYVQYQNRSTVLNWLKSCNVPVYEADLKIWQRLLTDEDIEL